MMLRRPTFLSSTFVTDCIRSLNRTRRVITISAAALSAGWVAGCATGDYAYVTTIATGERIQIPLQKGSPVLASKGDVTIRHAALVPRPNQDTEQKQLQYLFAFHYKGSVPLKSVFVEDVTDDHPIKMVEDSSPALVEQRWTATSRMFGPDEDALSWVAHLDNSMRVYRFTITRADGSKIVLDQGWLVPGWAKTVMRRALGLK